MEFQLDPTRGPNQGTQFKYELRSHKYALAPWGHLAGNGLGAWLELGLGLTNPIMFNLLRFPVFGGPGRCELTFSSVSMLLTLSHYGCAAKRCVQTLSCSISYICYDSVLPDGGPWVALGGFWMLWGCFGVPCGPWVALVSELKRINVLGGI